MKNSTVYIQRPHGNLPYAIQRLQPQTDLSDLPFHTCSRISFPQFILPNSIY